MRSQTIIPALILTLSTCCGVAPHVMAQLKTSPNASKPNVAPRRDEAFSILQKHYFLGRWQIFLNKDKVRAVNLSEGYSIVTMAPTWKVVFYRDNGGAKMYESTMESFLLTGIPLSGGYVIEGKIKKDTRPRKSFYKGLNTVKLDFPRLERTSVKPAWTLADVPKEAPVGLSEYWTSPAISNNDKVCQFLQKLFMVPSFVGYPVAFIDTRTDNTRNAVLDILSCRGLPPASVQIAYPSPTKYKMCKGQRDITLSSDRRDNFNEWADAIGKD